MVVRSRNHVNNQSEIKLPQVNRFFSGTWTWLKRAVFFGTPFALILITNVSPKTGQTFRSTDETTIGVLQYLPKDYYDNSDKYPVILFLHGFYERGIDSRDPEILQTAITELTKFGIPRTIRKGSELPFIVISPQLKHRFDRWPEWYIREVLDWAKENLRVDEKRIHVTGLSLGGGASFIAMQEFPSVFASGAPVCPNWNDPAKAQVIANENIAVWAFHGAIDDQVPIHTTTYMIDSINRSNPDLSHKAKVRVYDSARHAIWDRAYTADHSEQSPNMYEWMLGITKTRSKDNYLPVSEAGPDQTAKPHSEIVFSGAGQDSDGSIQGYRWAQMYGPAATIHDVTKKETRVTLTRRGSYMFRFTVTDDKSATDTDYVSVKVD